VLREAFFFEVPIYRVSESKFNTAYDRDLEKHWEWLESASDTPRGRMSGHLLRISENRFWETYGAPWRFNQVVGWIRLYVLGTQIRGELWMARARRYTRTGRRRYRWRGKAFEMSCAKDMTSAEIGAEVEERLQRCVKDLRSGKMHVDLECFRTASQFLNRRGLVDSGRSHWMSEE